MIPIIAWAHQTDKRTRITTRNMSGGDDWKALVCIDDFMPVAIELATLVRDLAVALEAAHPQSGIVNKANLYLKKNGLDDLASSLEEAKKGGAA